MPTNCVFNVARVRNDFLSVSYTPQSHVDQQLDQVLNRQGLEHTRLVIRTWIEQARGTLKVY
jgi:hypothetical protein